MLCNAQHLQGQCVCSESGVREVRGQGASSEGARIVLFYLFICFGLGLWAAAGSAQG